MLRLILILWLLPALVLGAPDITEVSGSTSDGAALTISGSGFGTQPNNRQVPYSFLDFNEGVAGQVYTPPSGWTVTYGDQSWEFPSYSDSLSRDGSVLFEAYAHGGWPNNASERQGIYSPKIGTGATKYMVSAWVWWEWDDAPTIIIPGGTNPQFKLMLLRNKPWGTSFDSYPVFLFEHNKGSDSHRVTMRPNLCTTRPTWDIYEMQPNRWQLLQLLVDIGDIDSYNATTKIYVDGALQRDESGFGIVCSGDGYPDAVYWAAYGGNSDGYPWRGVAKYDDCYFNDSWARVEIGNRDTYGACTVREIQPFTAWADDSVTVAFNAGTFPSRGPAYLYVIDNNDVPSAAFPIVVNEGYEPTALGDPTDLTIFGGN